MLKKGCIFASSNKSNKSKSNKLKSYSYERTDFKDSKD